MANLSVKTLQNFRRDTFRHKSGRRVKTLEEAVEFVNQRGFVFFWPIKDITLPSLWAAVAGDRPVADAHDDPGHVTWGWKDAQLGGESWYYAKVLRKRATMIALDLAPFFYALSENYGSPEHDYLTLYEQGRLTQEAKAVYEALLDDGPLDTVALRRMTHLTSRSSDYRFGRALTELQSDFKILPVGVSQSGGWRYAFIYELVPRHYPEIPIRARKIKEAEARQQLLVSYFRSVGAAQLPDITKLFGWRAPTAIKAVDGLVQTGFLRRDLELTSQGGGWLVLSELV